MIIGLLQNKTFVYKKYISFCYTCYMPLCNLVVIQTTFLSIVSVLKDSLTRQLQLLA